MPIDARIPLQVENRSFAQPLINLAEKQRIDEVTQSNLKTAGQQQTLNDQTIATNERVQQRELKASEMLEIVTSLETSRTVLEQGNVTESLKVMMNIGERLKAAGQDSSGVEKIAGLIKASPEDGTRFLQEAVDAIKPQAEHMARAAGLIPEARETFEDWIEDGRIVGKIAMPSGERTRFSGGSGTEGGRSFEGVPVYDEKGKYIGKNIQKADGTVIFVPNPENMPKGSSPAGFAVDRQGDSGFRGRVRDENVEDIGAEGAAKLEVAMNEWEEMSPLRVSEDGAIYQGRSDIALNEWETKKATEFQAEMAEAKRLNNAEIRSYTDATQRFDTWVDDAIDNSSAWTTGFIGNMVSAVPGTKAYNLRSTLESMAAFAGFETLNDMRQRSPTGGALGQVSQQELALLVSAFGSLNQGQSPSRFRRRVVEAQNAIQSILARKVELGEEMVNPYWSNEGVDRLPDVGGGASQVGRFTVEVVN